MAGSKTALQKTGNELKLTGQDSGQGDVDKETITGEMEEQESVRQYREKAGQYEALSESALESESIPLGQRQTIRRYFELIRPQGSEADAVQEEIRGTATE
jgi:predicted RNA-binding Zn ribbon-like protein